ncbi:MAG: hypothetical protein H6942_03560 [Candidatus Accumulibacter sp.]|uniref:hypothetical protein n=1 Tax=Accumulibacter sp. TaxID=2053492 RepID=UPI0025E369E8|nr:hypothetical protein [Accumulibacter sp.]MCP5247614.1 hypothetical protein [Accumulibacter sp.]
MFHIKGMRAFLIGLLMIAAATVTGLTAYRHFGRTPGELMDYVDRRLEGHPKLEVVAKPILAELRQVFDAPSVADRARIPFLVPPPPKRRGPDEVGRREPPPAGVRVWRVGPSGPITKIGDVARLARDGDHVEIEAGDYHQDVAVWEQSKLTIRGVNGAARLFADGRSAEGKAIWVIRHGVFDISNIDFVGAEVTDGNGAGIRFEGGHLRLRDCLFWGNQMGLLTGGRSTAPDATLVIENSEFAYSHVQNRWGHNLYVGTIASLTVTGSYFHHAGVGHLLKSRAGISDILYNRLTDESGGRASYELDFPNGGMVRLVGNVVQQQRDTEHSVLIAFGEEGYEWPTNVLLMGNNTLINDHPYGGTFLRVAAGADSVEAANNLLVGPGTYQVEDHLKVFNDVNADWGAFFRPSREDYRLLHPGARMAYQPSPDTELGPTFAPKAQYVHPRRVRLLSTGPTYVGAIQEVGQ